MPVTAKAPVSVKCGEKKKNHINIVVLFYDIRRSEIKKRKTRFIFRGEMGITRSIFIFKNLKFQLEKNFFSDAETYFCS